MNWSKVPICELTSISGEGKLLKWLGYFIVKIMKDVVWWAFPWNIFRHWKMETVWKRLFLFESENSMNGKFAECESKFFWASFLSRRDVYSHFNYPLRNNGSAQAKLADHGNGKKTRRTLTESRNAFILIARYKIVLESSSDSR